MVINGSWGQTRQLQESWVQIELECTINNPTNKMILIRARSSVDQLPVSSNWRKNDITRELMREDLQIELEALKVRQKDSSFLKFEPKNFWKKSQ